MKLVCVWVCLLASLLFTLSVSGGASASAGVTAHRPVPKPMVAAKPLELQHLNQVLVLVNKARSKARTCGDERFPARPKLRRDARLDLAAQRHASDMARHDYFSHTGRNGSDPGTRITQARYRWSAYGENIAAGFPTPRSVVRGWLTSEGHCRAVMGPYRDTGIG